MPDCKHTQNHVIDSRENEFGTRRRRECNHCGHRWTTQEITLDEGASRCSNFDPWALYRRQAIAKWLRLQLGQINRGGSVERAEYLESMDADDWIEPN